MKDHLVYRIQWMIHSIGCDSLKSLSVNRRTTTENNSNGQTKMQAKRVQ